MEINPLESTGGYLSADRGTSAANGSRPDAVHADKFTQSAQA
jgi:hypothetical protein